MTLSTFKALLWLLTLGVVGYLGFTLYDWRQNQGEMLAARATTELQLEYLKNVEAPEPPKRELHDYDRSIRPNFFDLNWTGKPKPPPIPDRDPETEIEVAKPKATPPDKLLRVLFIQQDTSFPDLSKAWIRYTDSALARLVEEPVWIYPGDRLPEPHALWEVAGIDAEQVLFRRMLPDGGQDPEVEDATVSPPSAKQTKPLITILGEGDEVATRAEKSFREVDATTFTGRRPSQTVEVRPNVYQLGDESLQQINENYLDILSTEVRTRTYRNPGGAAAGIQIMEVAPGSVAAQHGAKTGDVIKSINGSPVNSTQEAISYVKNNKDNYNTWTVVVWNSGAERTVTYNSP